MFLDILIVVVAYLLGSLSSALIVSKYFHMDDPRSYGSGNPGASNMLRSGNKKAAALTLLGDALKGIIAVAIARWLGNSEMVVAWAAIAVVLGHMWPVFFQFKGGKGVATALGVIVAMSFWLTILCIAIWGVIAFKFKKSSLAALITAAIAPFAAFIMIDRPSWGWALLLISILVIYRHRSNIQRILNGQELDLTEKVHTTDSKNPHSSH